MIVLGLDLGQYTGWAVDTKSKFGHWNNKKKPKHTFNEGLILFEHNLMRIINHFDPDYVVYEKPIHGHFNATRRLCNYEGLLLFLSEKHKFPLVEFSPKEIKMMAGKGNADKHYMRQSLKELHNIDLDNDHCVDAIWGVMWGHKYLKPWR